MRTMDESSKKNGVVNGKKWRLTVVSEGKKRNKNKEIARQGSGSSLPAGGDLFSSPLQALLFQKELRASYARAESGENCRRHIPIATA